ncbi:VOC family protein [Planococcus citreus]|uniref:Putative 3-demethylubiquinone-9 3-methyltransferase (Glyoxalase superfamily) n=1 Tax=Planococcus citreus TaxID=1373 RepID=A0A497YF01_9BACL|nr:VOC family protein [Planococcus citreus]RLJ86192.1 putative 3-demethylubiquinone-9 3-methyltransferase (glyoxalase superfamily) [Planococcus citreus]
MAQTITTFLLFQGQAEEAMKLYTSIFNNSHIDSVRYREDGKVEQARFTLAGTEYMCIDSPIPHEFTFTPAVSLFVQVDDEVQFDKVYSVLSEGGKVLMEPGDYGFSPKFGWCNDRFGVSWQVTIK